MPSPGSEPLPATAAAAGGSPLPTLRDLYRARARIQGLARRTPLVRSAPLAERLGVPVFLKDETRQPTGAFKIRGAANRLRSLPPETLARGVVAVSTGNHGRAVAHVARELGARAAIFVSERVPADKLAALREAGAELVVHGRSQDEAEVEARRRARERELAFVPPFDDPEVIAGQGTLGLELLEDLPGLSTALVPLSGGGLIAGVALALKRADPAIRVIGVSMERGAAMHASLRAGAPVGMPEEETLADSLQGGIGLDNAWTLRMVRELVDEVVLVPEEAIAQAMAFAFAHHRMVLEGAGAVGVAALLHGGAAPRGPTAVVASGGNVAPERFLDLVRDRLPDPEGGEAWT